MKKIPTCVQSLICASNQINNHRKAVEELVYNALDAGATSIALRINIQENTLQVIDNGCGVSYKDLRCIGEKYMTSNFVDLGTPKSAPNKYGFCGQSLPNLINVSKTVKITSRHEKSEETWMKLFEHGKEKQLKLCNIRPSKGTTIEIKGLLYNLKIHKKDILNELQSIKTFMEHVALVHSNISLSLRDDSRNEIIFKMHKNRDMYQTLSTLYNIGREDIQELQVEKNKYKVTAFLGNSDNEYGKDFIFINGKFIPNTSKLHKTVNNNLNKLNKLQGVRKPNNKNFNKDEENSLFQKKKPCYFIFIKCPYIDYNMSNSPKQSSLEFKDWNQVMKLLNKLIQFSKGDMRLKKVNSIEKDNETNKTNKNNTKEQVKKIVHKILGTHSKKPGATHLHNGIKGKQIKRKVWKPSITVAPNVIKLKENYNKALSSTNNVMNIDNSDDSKVNINKPNEKLTIKKKENYVSPKQKEKKNAIANIRKSCIKSHIGKAYNSKFKKVSKNNEEGNAINIQLQKKQLVKKTNKNKKLGFNKGELVLRKFEMQTDSVKKRCIELEQRTRNLLKQLHERNYKQFVTKNNMQFRNLTKNNINVSVHKQTDEIIIHNFKPKALQNNITNNNLKSKKFQSNYDLVKTILQSQQGSNEQRHIDHETNNSVAVRTKQTKSKTNKAHKSIDNETEVISSEPVITFQSHKYYAHNNMNIENNTYHGGRHMNLQNEKDNDNLNVCKNPRTFITKQSRENFIIPNTSHKHDILKKKCSRTGYAKQFKSSIKRLFNQTSKNVNMKKQIMHNLSKSSHTIEFSESSFHVTDNKRFKNFIDSSMNHGSNKKGRKNIQESGSQLFNYNNFSVNDDAHIALNTNTYTVSNINNNGYTIEEDNWNLYSTYNIEHANDKTIENNTLNVDISFDDNCLNHQNFIFVSKSQEHEQNKEILNAVEVCETILQSQELFDKEITESDVNNMQNLKHNIIEDTNLQRLQIKVNEQKTTEYKEQITHDERIHTQDFLEEFSQYLDLTSDNMEVNNVSKANDISKCSIITTTLQNLSQNTAVIEKQRTIQGNDKVNTTKDPNVSEFNFKNRLCFLPKGMSPIFENCHTRKNCEYNLSEDYYDNEMYNNFVDDVKNNAEVFKPKIHEAKEFTSKAIDKVNFKLNKDNSLLKFDGRSLNTAKVLGQIDEKFIAAIMKGGCNIEAMLHFLVLFDQHAVHERIRLENNLSDYFSENQWKPVNIDGVTLKMSQDDILYIHNYRHKFEQVGLKWTVVNTNEVSFDAIPQAILGKNPRPVDKVIKAVKNLITEEINVIKMQGGCVSLYPKSIMDLVFSEACRYAIKFGDKLSKSECVELIKNLSECKTPFQCAHGRPVMAVIMHVKLNVVEYKVNCNKIMDWNGKN